MSGLWACTVAFLRRNHVNQKHCKLVQLVPCVLSALHARVQCCCAPERKVHVLCLQALLVIPKTLAVNAAKDATELVAKLRTYHNHAQKSEDKRYLGNVR